MTALSREAQLLTPAVKALTELVATVPEHQRQEARFQVLEATAAAIAGFSLKLFQKSFGTKPLPLSKLETAGLLVATEIRKSGIEPALAVSALAREALATSEQRRSGAYHTDFRLAQHVAKPIAAALGDGAKVIDPACGAGILLVALSIEKCRADEKRTKAWLSKSVFASDLTDNALRGTLIALACLTNDISVLKSMRAKWKVQDSLLAGPGAWQEYAPNGFDAVIANPPWEKVKLTRHEFLQSNGIARHYGSDYAHIDSDAYENSRQSAARYGGELAARYSLLAGEPDLYVAFAELSLSLVAPGGHVGLILPGGLIRSQGTAALREAFVLRCSDLKIEVMDNRARFFEIDTRFKFVLVSGKRAAERQRRTPILLSHSKGTDFGISSGEEVRIGRRSLLNLRPDLSIPEVKSEAEWSLFAKLCEQGIDWSDPASEWFPEFVREVDMTRDRPSFSGHTPKVRIPVIEGRMVHQHRFGAKSYEAGRGRSAEWSLNAPGASEVQPQFWTSLEHLSNRVQERTKILRAGFCDITGQTNERSCLAAAIPPGVVCGNKVPTIIFPNSPEEDRIWLWIGIANSFVFDWMLRRIITTTVNYFHLLSLPLPPLSPSSLPGRQVAESARTLAKLDREGSTRSSMWAIAEQRAKIEQLVIQACGLSFSDVQLIFEDFPLVDRNQPPLAGEIYSTVTKDSVLAQMRNEPLSERAKARSSAARKMGAIPFVPAQVAGTVERETEGRVYG